MKKYASQQEVEKIGRLLEGEDVVIMTGSTGMLCCLDGYGRTKVASFIRKVVYERIDGMDELVETVYGDGWVAEAPSEGMWRIWQGDKKEGVSFHQYDTTEVEGAPKGWDDMPRGEE